MTDARLSIAGFGFPAVERMKDVATAAAPNWATAPPRDVFVSDAVPFDMPRCIASVPKK
jgi:hypothetical protein